MCGCPTLAPTGLYSAADYSSLSSAVSSASDGSAVELTGDITFDDCLTVT